VALINDDIDAAEVLKYGNAELISPYAEQLRKLTCVAQTK
jgi:hypothetical protein